MRWIMMGVGTWDGRVLDGDGEDGRYKGEKRERSSRLDVGANAGMTK